jgi:hypothetical protein
MNNTATETTGLNPFYSGCEAAVYAERQAAAGPFTVLIQSGRGGMRWPAVISRWPNENGGWTFWWAGDAR